MQNRSLYFGDNLEILQDKFPGDQGYFDLIYLDPPFNSNRNYNVLFKEGLVESEAQIHAFEDTWHWTKEASSTFRKLVTESSPAISDLMQALEKIVGHNDVLAYLTMMTVRLIELHRVLKPTGSLYLHCDPTASHYLKIVMDTIFGNKNFRNELIWLYKGRELSHKNYNKKHDVILFYTKSSKYKFNWDKVLEPLEESSRNALSRYHDEKGFFIVRYKKGGGFAPIEKEGSDTYRQYVPEGVPPRDWFYADYARKSEQLGYETQKPESLLERIIKASSDEGDWVLDPFCGCGTTVSVAERLNRKWVGIDISMLAINLIQERLIRQFKAKGLKDQIHIDGAPKDMAGARALFNNDPFNYEYWALHSVGARPAKSKTQENMRGADKGIDGVITFIKGFDKSTPIYGKIIVQIKGGRTGSKDIRDLRGVIDREKSDGGLFITLESPTKPMQTEAVEAGSFKAGFGPVAHEFPKIQIMTAQDILDDKQPSLPVGLTESYFKEARAIEIDPDQAALTI